MRTAAAAEFSDSSYWSVLDLSWECLLKWMCQRTLFNRVLSKSWPDRAVPRLPSSSALEDQGQLGLHSNTALSAALLWRAVHWGSWRFKKIIIVNLFKKKKKKIPMKNKHLQAWEEWDVDFFQTYYWTCLLVQPAHQSFLGLPGHPGVYIWGIYMVYIYICTSLSGAVQGT